MFLSQAQINKLRGKVENNRSTDIKLSKAQINKLTKSMKINCIICKKDTENKNPKVFKTKNKRIILKSICSECNNKKSRFISKNEESGLLSSLGIRTPLSKIPGLNILF